jgi:hypothetical protein
MRSGRPELGHRPWNNLNFTMPSFLLGTGRPDPRHARTGSSLAKGGIVPATPGGRLALIGEGGEDEAVIPLSKLGQMGGRGETPGGASTSGRRTPSSASCC